MPKYKELIRRWPDYLPVGRPLTEEEDDFFRECYLRWYLYKGLEKLTSAEAQVVALYRNYPALTSKDIAGKLERSEETVEAHFKRAMHKCDVHNRVELLFSEYFLGR
jgi:DNA-binding NarL/FixJ family response regulator